MLTGTASYSGTSGSNTVNLTGPLVNATFFKIILHVTEGRLICQLIMEGKSERDCGKEMGLSRNTFVYRRDKLFKKLRSELKDYI